VTAGLIAVAFGVISRSSQVATIVLAVALAHLVPAALLYGLLAWRKNVNLISCLVSGFLIGALPIGFWTFPLRYPDLKTNAWVGGTQTMADGVPTLAGWLQYGGLLLFFGSIGLIGGLIFWKFVRKHHLGPDGRLNVAEHRSQSEKPVLFSWAVLPLCAVLLVGGVFLIPVIKKDRSCHNLFRDGRNHASPELGIDLAISKDSWEDLRRFFEDFSSKNNLDFRGSIDDSHSSVSVLSLSMCKEPGFSVRSNEQYWTHRGGGPIPGRGTSIAVFSLHEDINWIPIARKLVDALDEQWPSKVRFRDGGGRIIPLEQTTIGSHHSTSQDEL